MKNPIASAALTAAKSDSTLEIAKEYAEVVMDAFLNDGFLKDLPFMGTAVALLKAGQTIREQLLLHKIEAFLQELDQVEQGTIQDMVRRLDSDISFQGRVGTVLIEALDKMSVERQPRMLARAFRAYADGQVTGLELRRLALAIERFPTFELPSLRAFYDGEVEQRMTTEKAVLLALSSAGLAMNNGGFDGGVLVPTSTFDLFITLGLDQV